MFENSILYYEIDSYLLDILKQDNNQIFDKVDVQLLSSSGYQELDDTLSLVVDYPSNFYQTGDTEEPFADCTRLSLLYNNGDEHNSIIAMGLVFEDTFEIELADIIKSLSICMDCIIYDNFSDFHIVEQYFKDFWIPDVSILTAMSLSGNFNPENPLFEAMYKEVTEHFQDDKWDIIFSHYNDSNGYFSNETGLYGYRNFIIALYNNKILAAGNNIWLWSCNAGYSTEEKRAVAFEIANRYGIEVKAAPGTIVLQGIPEGIVDGVETYSDLSYDVVDLHGTKYEHVDTPKLKGWRLRKFLWYTKRHRIPSDQEWLYFRGE